jgi:hypothetical protein
MTKLFLEKDLVDPNCWVARDGSGKSIGTIYRVERRGWLVSDVEAGREQVAADVAFETFEAAQEALWKALA